MKKLYRIMIFSLTLICLPLSVSAQTMEEKIRNLEATVEQLQKTLIEMRAEMAKTKAADASEKGGIVRSDGEKITLSTTGGGLKLKSDNGNSFQFGGRLMLDYDNYDFDGDPQGRGRVESDGSDIEWRRTRITAKGTVKKDWAYGLTINISDDDESADINTAYMRYDGFKPLSITVGKFKEPFSLERLASSKWINTIERGMIIDVVNEGHGQPQTAGVMLSGHHAEMANLNWALGVFDDDQKDDDGDSNYAYTARIAATPRISEDSFLHLGFAYSERERDEEPYSVRTRFGVHTNNVLRTTLADLPSGDDASQWGLEAAFVTGPFSLQAEYVDLEVDGSTRLRTDEDDDGNVIESIFDSFSDLEADGYYIQGAWTITGEQRGYKTRGAYFDKIKPKGAMGAWELVARYEEIDVEYNGATNSIQRMAGNGEIDLLATGAGRADNDAEKMLLGINWYPNNNVKFMLNYIDAEADLSGRDNVDGDAISLRAQYAF